MPQALFGNLFVILIYTGIISLLFLGQENHLFVVMMTYANTLVFFFNMVLALLNGYKRRLLACSMYTLCSLIMPVIGFGVAYGIISFFS